ncbi:MAG: phosphatidate cytidylyltransferase [Clostridia bacterium]
MKQRVLSGIVMAVIFILMLVTLYTPVFYILMGVLSVIAVHEIEQVVQVRNWGIRILSALFALFMPIYYGLRLDFSLALVLVPLAILMLLCMLARYDSTPFSQVSSAFAVTLMVSFGFSTFVMVRDCYLDAPDKFGKMDGLYLILFGFICSWVTDIGAYFVGRFLGRHKLSPKISPKKTVEGAAGGVVFAALINALVLFVFDRWIFDSEYLAYYVIIPLSIVLSIISMFGDLSASVIKRNFGVKDFGKLIPGHGGIMDRFDSCLFVFPTLFFAVKIIEII